MKKLLPPVLLTSLLLAAGAGGLPGTTSPSSSSAPVLQGQPAGNGAPPASSPVSTVNARVGVRFSIRLASNATTGYNWSTRYDKARLTLLGSRYISPVNTNGKVGVPGEQEFTFRPLKKGTTTITFAYARPWEKGVPPADTREYTVVIK